MDLNLLSLFVAVADAESFSKAAAKLGLPRSSVSRGVATLERSLGVELFSRTTRHVALTTAGASFYAKVSPELAALREALGTLPEREEQPSGELRLSAPHDLGAVVLPNLLSSFSKRYPAIQLDARLTNRRVDLVAEGYDAALRISMGKRTDSSLVARKLSDLEMQLFASPGYIARAGAPKSIEELDEHPWVWMPGGKLPANLPTPKKKASIMGDDPLFLRETLKAGAGIGPLPTFLAWDDLALGNLVRVLPRVAIGNGALYFVYPPAKHVPRKVQALRDWLIDAFTARPLVDHPC